AGTRALTPTTAATVRERIVYVDREAPAPVVPAASSAAPALLLPVDTARGSAARPAASPSVSTPGRLAEERAILDSARVALGRSDGEAALGALAKHEKRFPAGLLAEERDALAVQAFVLVGRYDEARTRGTRFRERYPGSMLLPALDASLGSIP
ncbi:MAG TPA: hypothetical protein VM925_11630, partial [Labilithrix sp.]|nr:hypothetical protein [Labilithrix sp.]